MRPIDADALIESFRETYELIKKSKKKVKSAEEESTRRTQEIDFLEAIMRVKAAPTIEEVKR